MNRKILFKAKRVDNGEWIEGSLIHGVFFDHASGADVYFILNVDNIDYDCFEDIGDNGFYEVVPDTICQYTGLDNSNGDKIWENDIIQIPDEEELYTVAWDCEEARFVLVRNEIFMIIHDFNDYYYYDLTVMGNRFDNPDLLDIRE